MKKLFVILLSPAFLFSCGKEETPPKTKAEMLSELNWKFSAATVNGADVSANIPACSKDNILKFNASGTGIADEGTLKCNSGDPQTYALTWSFLSGETQLKVNPPLFSGGSDTYTLVTLTDAQLVVSQMMTLPPPFGASNVVLTFIH